ncbi:PhnE/PtxC family ABC transporter permease [Corynebacterium uberis]|uniref:PhnE/PtxC family ABC transporter permease n=2 Tax=Corynebacteriaceae TaxID=1653 RepID=UPI001D0A8619|nr:MULTISPECIES: ABC transporter permease subunit [Corynebacterium]MCZ9308849.1 ABC transporter permease subunit [Corynebacterium sp. c6VSa_13]UDL76918.1 ABC transporter permease subunit [Corynebacterium uberis]UDL79129.1 ABC transporter permease subunit [Corynebacterium uberis]UDL81333.1 ABC transporter permease subunit [Corynebacterium uberis]UDL83546.1 ABC transporter permease subunit [Corynebacterium uberis]
MILLAAGLWSMYSLGINAAALARSGTNAVAFVRRLVPLDFPGFAETAQLVGQTLAIVIAATAVSVALSLPVALLAARATTPAPWARRGARAVIVGCRAVPDLILAIIFVRAFGLGATAGVLAMGIHSVGMVAKLYADAIEDLDPSARRGVAATGASRAQQIIAAIPQALAPQLIATALHRCDINLRTSVLLGYVGVGGIGLAIADALRVLNYQRGMALALIVLVLCIAMEMVSGVARAVLQRGGAGGVGRRGVLRGGGSAGASIRENNTTPPWTWQRSGRTAVFALVTTVVVVSFVALDSSPAQLTHGISLLPETLALLWPPTTGGAGAAIWAALLVTIQIALAATVIGMVAAVPIGILAARNVVANRAVHSFFRLLIVVVRGIPELIVAIIFVVISGLGAIAGTLALSLGAVGLLSKLVADSVEETDQRVQHAVAATGANPGQVFFAATVRQAAPALVAHILYLLDTNVRSATLLGVVGAGGVGFLLLNAARINQFGVVSAIVLIMVGIVVLIEACSMWLRAVMSARSATQSAARRASAAQHPSVTQGVKQ